MVCGGDNTWSDDCTGDGMNWFGLQLMLMRDELRGTTGDGSWTEFTRCQTRLHNGYGQNSDATMESEREISQWMEVSISRSFS